MKEDSGCRKRFRNGGSYGRADFTGRRAYGARGGQGDPARGRAYDKKRRDACADGTERCGKVDTEGKILFKGNDITEEAADKRAKAGMFLSFQEPLEVPGLSLESFIRSALSEQGRNKMRVWNFRKELKAAMEVLHMDPSYAGRDLNVGFSGGEKKKSEILQLMMLKPDLAILDETDSGLDVDAVRLASEGIREYQKENPDGALLIITHSTRILDALHVDATHIMVNGHIVASGDASLVDKINREGYEEYEKLAQKGEDER